MEQNLLKIKEIIENLLAAMDFSGEVSIDDQDGNFIRFNIRSDEAAFLIGRCGDNLKSLQQIIRAITGKQLEAPVRFVIDVNNYSSGQIELLKQSARNLAQEAREQKADKWLAPMNAYERRIIHMALADEAGIKTESEGEGENRRIVIKPSNKE